MGTRRKTVAAVIFICMVAIAVGQDSMQQREDNNKGEETKNDLETFAKTLS